MEDGQAHTDDPGSCGLQQDPEGGLAGATDNDPRSPARSCCCPAKQVLSLTRSNSVLTRYSTELAKPSIPRSLCREAALSIVRTLPSSLINHNTLAEVCKPPSTFSANSNPALYSDGAPSFRPLDRRAEDGLRPPTGSSKEADRIPCH